MGSVLEITLIVDSSAVLLIGQGTFQFTWLVIKTSLMLSDVVLCMQLQMVSGSRFAISRLLLIWFQLILLSSNC